MGLLPYVIQQLGIVRQARKEFLEHVLEIKPHVQTMTLCTAYDRHPSSGSFALLHVADEEPVLAAKGDLAHQLLDTVVSIGQAHALKQLEEVGDAMANQLRLEHFGQFINEPLFLEGSHVESTAGFG